MTFKNGQVKFIYLEIDGVVDQNRVKSGSTYFH